jgi:tetratricopeptide (TPR) repeat protein/predicted Ser/Thr protein kinase
VSLEAAAEPGAEKEPLRRFGDYELLEEIARGGMGVVYRARQASLNRIVAVKMILTGQLASIADVQRFRAEAEAAARLQHPNVVAIHEIGQHEGQDYFSMDYVEGRNLAEIVGQKSLPPKQAANYLKDIAEAIHYAHQQGILHRDLKPSNILIDQSDEPRVTDFGLAKQIKGASDLTVSGQVLGSPNFMPPEQAAGKRGKIGPHSDVYALGAILFYMLTARPPFAAESMNETLRLVANSEPPSPRLLSPCVPRDLETICLKCLEKEPRLRYASAQELADELNRFLRDEPIRARPVNRIEKGWRWCVRKPAVATAIGLVLVLLLVVGVGSPIAAFRINRERQRAQADRKKAENEAFKSRQVARFLTDMLEGVGPSKALGRDTTMLREILNKTAERVGKELTNQPEVELDLRTTLANTYEELGLYEQMEGMARQSLALARVRLGEENASVARALFQLGMAQFLRANYEQAAGTHREALSLRRKLFGEENLEVAESLAALAIALQYGGKPTEAAGMQQEALAMVRKLRGNEHSDVASSLTALADNLKQLGRLAEAEAADREAVALLRKLPDKQPDLAAALNNLANVLVEQGKPGEAEKADREALTLRRKLQGQEHPDVAESLTGLARDLLGRGEYAEAEALAREGLAMRKKFLGEEHDVVAETLVILANALRSQEKLGEAESTFRQALTLARKVLGNDNPSIPIYLNELGVVLYRQEKLAEAEEAHRESLALYKKLLGNEHSYIASALGNLALVLKARGDLAGAETLLREALAMNRKLLGSENPRIAFGLDTLARTLRDEGKIAEAESAAREALGIRRKALGEDHPDVLHAMGTLASVLQQAGKLAEAEALYQNQVVAMLARLPGDDLRVASALAGLSSTLLAEGKFTEAEEVARRCLAIRERKLPDDWVTFNTRSVLGGTLLGQQKYAEAEPLLLSGYEGMKQREARVRGGNGEPRLREALQRLVQLYKATNRPEQAADWEGKLDEFEKSLK